MEIRILKNYSFLWAVGLAGSSGLELSGTMNSEKDINFETPKILTPTLSEWTP